MNTYLTLSLLAIVCTTVAVAEDMPKPDQLTEHCFKNIPTDERLKCLKKLTDAGVNIETFANLKGKECCLMWDVPACFKPLIQAKCTKEEEIAFGVFKGVFYKYLNGNQCNGFEEGSTACKA